MRGHSGFTLAELLVAVAVFSLFAAAALETVVAAAGLERATAERAEVRGTLQQAAQQFALDLRLADAVDNPTGADCPDTFTDPRGTVAAVRIMGRRIAYCLQGDALYRREGSNPPARLAAGLEVGPSASYLGLVDKVEMRCLRTDVVGKGRDLLCLRLRSRGGNLPALTTTAFLRGS